MARYFTAKDEQNRVIASDTMRGLRFIRKQDLRLTWRQTDYNSRGPCTDALPQDMLSNLIVWRAGRGIAHAYTDEIGGSGSSGGLTHRLISRGDRYNRQNVDATVYVLGKPTVTGAGGVGARAWDENGNPCFNSNDRFVRVAGVFKTIVNGEALLDKYQWNGSDKFSPYKTITTGLPAGRTYAVGVSQGMWVGDQGKWANGDWLSRYCLTCYLDANNNIAILQAQDWELQYSGSITGYFRNVGNVEVTFFVMDVTGL